MEADEIITLLLVVVVFGVALVHSSVGLGGASSYLGIVVLSGTSTVVMKPTVLALNIIVGLVCTVRFLRAGFFSWRAFWPFAVTSVPASFIGGCLILSDSLDKLLIGLVLFYAGTRLFFRLLNFDETKTMPVRISIALPLGAAMGLLSGLTGIGGGIFLNPVLALMSWADSHETRGVTAAFVLANSVAGLIPRISGLPQFPEALVYWAPAVLVAAWIGTEFQETTLRRILSHARLLSLVPVVAGFRLVL